MVNVNIIGAGILGAATAYELALKGHKVIIADKEAAGRATSAAAGIICPWISKRRNMDWYELAKRGASHYTTLIPQLTADGENNTGYKKVGAMKLHDDIAKLKELKALAEKRQTESPEIGEIDLLDAVETKKRFPYLEEHFSSLYISGAARVDGNKLRTALLQAAEKHGAVYVKGEARLLTANNNVDGMEINQTRYEADWTVAANGVWMNELLKSLHPKIKFQTQKGEIMHVQTEKITTDDMPVIIPPNNQYILPSGEKRIIIGATHETVHELDTCISAGGMQYMLDEAIKMAPGISQTRFLEVRSGFRPFTKNHLPVFGGLEGVQGLLIANGLGASGLTTGPFIANQLAKIISNEETNVDPAKYAIRLGE